MMPTASPVKGIVDKKGDDKKGVDKQGIVDKKGDGLTESNTKGESVAAAITAVTSQEVDCDSHHGSHTARKAGKVPPAVAGVRPKSVGPPPRRAL